MGYMIDVYSYFTMILLFSNLTTRILYYAFSSNKLLKSYIVLNIKSSIFFICLTFIRFFETCYFYFYLQYNFYFEQYDKKVMIYTFCWICIQSLILIYQNYKAKLFNQDEDCSICYESMIDDDDTITTPCNHTFHKDCLKKWVINKNNCPLCRSELPTNFMKEHSS